MKKVYKIICIVQVFNELEKGNLKRFVKYLKPLIDGIVTYDDGSTDGSYEYLQKITPYVIRGGKNNFKEEITHKCLLLEKAKELGADFVLWLDADEVLSVSSKETLQTLCREMADRDIDGLSMHEINIWRSRTWQRTDSLYNIGWFVRLWRIKPNTKFNSSKRGLHHQQFPATLKKIEKTNKISVLHYGFSTEKNIAFKYLTYKSHGQRGYQMLDRLIDEEKLTVKKNPEELFPKGLYKADEPKPQRKTISGSMKYVEKYKMSVSSYILGVQKQDFPFVSIITPTYNRAELLKITAESILSQDYLNLEYIIIDDGSKDKTKEVVSSLKKKFKNRKIVYLKQKNAGETAAVNKGFSQAKGKYIAVVNSDDPLLPGAIDEMVEYMEKHPEVLAVYPDWEMIDGKGKTIQTVHPRDYSYIKMLKEHYCIPGPGTIFRKKALELTDGRSSEFTYLGDFAFWLKLGMYGKLYHYPKVLATFRMHKDSQGVNAHGEKMAAEHKKLVDWVFVDPDLPKNARKVRQAAYASAYFHAARESVLSSQKTQYYTRSFLADPRIFANKLFYEAIKLKHRFLHNLRAYNA